VQRFVAVMGGVGLHKPIVSYEEKNPFAGEADEEILAFFSFGWQSDLSFLVSPLFNCFQRAI
jgi:hypothetical protein